MPLPKDVHFLVPEAVMYYFTWQRDFEDVIKLRIHTDYYRVRSTLPFLK